MSNELKDFDEIRPFNDDEIEAGIRELLADEQFREVLKSFSPWLPPRLSAGLLRAFTLGVRTSNDFQLRLMRPAARHILRKSSSGRTFTFEGIEPGEERYTFISNHRDIVMDSAILSMMLNEAKFPTTCEIAIGDNLIVRPWIRTLVRLNKSFLVRRSLPPRESLQASKLLSAYMHYSINTKHENIWIAQREGRAKDSDDRTQESLLKMLAMGGEGTVTQRLKDLHLVPLTISYEYDPCDYLKAQEFQLKRDNPLWKKSKQDDYVSMRTGILGWKGHIHYHASPCIDSWLDQIADLPKAEAIHQVALRLDRDIHKAYRLFHTNYIADDLLTGIPDGAEQYTHRQKLDFEKYIKSRIALVDIPNKDEAFLRERLLTMYANPVRNQRKATETAT